jgi:membrane protease YdiL (CAAX protease family)
MTTIKVIFWNTGQRRLRAGWRLLIQFALFVALLIVVAVVVKAIGRGTDAAAVIGSTLYLLLGLGLAGLVGRFLDRRPFAEYGFHLGGGWWLDLGFGLLLGAFLISGIFVAEGVLGWIQVAPAAADGPGLVWGPVLVFGGLLVQLAVAVNEEFTFRGFQLRNLAEGLLGRRITPRRAVVLAFLLSSTLFGAAHATNPNATLVSTLGVLLGGLALGLPYLLTGELAVSIGLHVGWNLFQGTVYGFPVSGIVPARRLLELHQGGPDLWTGGAFGPEAGLLLVVWMPVGCGLTVLWVWWRRNALGVCPRLARYESVSPTKVAEAALPESQ